LLTFLLSLALDPSLLVSAFQVAGITVVAVHTALLTATTFFEMAFHYVAQAGLSTFGLS
jgi:hypothetical protein